MRYGVLLAVGTLAASTGCTTLIGEDFDGYGAASTVAPSAHDGGDAGADIQPATADAAGDDAATGDAEPVPSSCSDGVHNGDETDTDCGGKDCAPCAPGQSCGWSGDCTSAVCANAVCQAPACNDFQRNGDESDVDCGGGVCPPCAAQRTCETNEDCESGYCSNHLCTTPGCTNGQMDPGETDIDCGGVVCPHCEAGQLCSAPADCVAGVCSAGRCAGPACDDAVLNGSESDVDCGGSACAPCGVGDGCLADTDCESASCQGGICARQPCDNGVCDGAETDVDCGGSACAPCGDGFHCSADADCMSAACLAGFCGVAHCSNAIQDSDESDADCGGMDCRPCAAGQVCAGGPDCLSGTCLSGQCSRTVTVSAPGGAVSYGIEPTEVTQQAYAAFLAEMSASTSGQPTYCSWNTTYFPSTAGDGCTAATFNPAAKPRAPVTCVDWCDAQAYCAWAGLRLCGAIAGGATAYDAFGDAAASQWQNACSSQGTHSYPYGDEVQPDACNTSEYAAGSPLRAAEVSACHGPSLPFANVYDLSGNVWEWEDSCSKYKNANDDCRIRGGDFDTTTAHCRRDSSVKRNTARANTGFRCCT